MISLFTGNYPMTTCKFMKLYHHHKLVLPPKILKLVCSWSLLLASSNHFLHLKYFLHMLIVLVDLAESPSSSFVTAPYCPTAETHHLTLFCAEITLTAKMRAQLRVWIKLFMI